jgi:peptidoglycan/LPS O-acetylase OafA/YrhL
MQTTTDIPGGSGLLRINFFPGLNELRALAALCVILGHIEQRKDLAGLPFHYWFPIPGKLGVVLFFVLSGFLITAILINEKTSSARVNLKQFYLKRVLRIWPLYFLVVGASILVINHIAIYQVPALSEMFYRNLRTADILLLLFILPNYVHIFMPYLTQVWSIGIEEQFYLAQPMLVKFTKSASTLIMVMIVAVFAKEYLLFINKMVYSSVLNDIAKQAEYFGCLAIGCIGALVCHAYPDLVKRLIHNKIAQSAAFMFFIASLVVIRITNSETAIDYRIHAITFLIMIVNAATNADSRYNLNNRALDYLGKISYGLYMYHEIGIGTAIAIVTCFRASITSYLFFELIVYTISLSVTILISALSFRYFEGYFLSLKKKLPA